MVPQDPTFRDQLLDTEPLDPHRQKQLEQQVRDLVDPKITGLQWVYWALFQVGAGLIALFFVRGVILLSRQGIPRHVGPGPELFVLGMWISLLLSLFGAAGALYFMIRRRVDSRLQLRLGKIMPAGAFLLIVISFMYGCDDPVHKPEATWMGVYALAAFVLTSSITLWNQIVAADQHAKEHMLRIEYRLAELAERLPPPQPKQ